MRLPNVRFVVMASTLAADTTIVNAPTAKRVDLNSRTVHYVLVSTLKERLRKAFEQSGFESARAWARAAGLKSESHAGHLLNGSGDEGKVEVRTLEALARAANVAPAWIVFGVGSESDDPKIGSLLLKIDSRPGLREAINNNPERWFTSTITKALATAFQSDSDGVPLGGWERALDSLEPGRVTKGSAADVARATSKQVGRRPKLPGRGA